MARQINKIIVHCTATPEGRNVTVDEIRRWHVEERNWSDIGYHWIVTLNGTLEKGRPEHIQGAHAKGFNKNSIGLCYVGGVDEDMKPKDTRTEGQKETIKCILEDLKVRYPNAEIIGHRDVSSKACPSFDAKAEYNNI
jgi:N-acetylmuramoyl-L-alanine amidase